MNDQDTITLTCPSGKEMVIKSYLTAREHNVLRNIILEETKVTQSGSEAPGSVLQKKEEELIKYAVVSYDGSTDSILQRLVDAKPSKDAKGDWVYDYKFALAEIDKAVGNFN